MVFLQSFKTTRSDGRAARHRSAKPLTPVRIRFRPRIKNTLFQGCFLFVQIQPYSCIDFQLMAYKELYYFTRKLPQLIFQQYRLINRSTPLLSPNSNKIGRPQQMLQFLSLQQFPKVALSYPRAY